MRKFAVLLFIVAIVSGSFYLLPDDVKMSIFAADGIRKELTKKFDELIVKIPDYRQLPTILGITNKLPRINLPTQLPSNVEELAAGLIPVVQEVITNTQKEELYLKAPVSVSLPEVKIENFDQQLSVPLEPFEIKDTRRVGKPWTLTVSVGDLNGERGVISRENISLKIRNDSIEGGDSGIFTVGEGGKLTIAAPTGLGKGVTKIRPWLSIKIPRDSYSGAYRAEVESSLE